MEESGGAHDGGFRQLQISHTAVSKGDIGSNLGALRISPSWLFRSRPGEWLCWTTESKQTASRLSIKDCWSTSLN